MYVTSDIFDLRRIARFKNFKWQENLLGGVVVHGTEWRGYQASARFMLEAAKYCDIADKMHFAGYIRAGDARPRRIAPKSFEKLILGQLSGARSAVGARLVGELETIGSRIGVNWVGGEAGLKRHYVRGPSGPQWIDDYPYSAFYADFIYPLREPDPKDAIKLLHLAVEILGAEYGYYFVRDELCVPFGYPYGLSPSLDLNPLSNVEAQDISDWGDFVDKGRLWTGAWPTLRDLFEVNLLSERHTSTPVEGLGYLHEWIAAGPGRGRLEDLGQGRLLWILTDQELSMSGRC